MTTTTHTPTPWRINKRASLNVENAHRSIASCNGYDGRIPDGGTSENEANASHIVACVNAHDALVAALQAMATMPEYDQDDAHRLRGIARAALRAAGIAESGVAE